MAENYFIRRDAKAVICWLWLCLALVALMVGVGGYTRLSGSGLSITSWKLVHGVIPPLSEEQWQEEFASYKLSPQYQKINNGMSQEEFKQIFWPEFLHRLLGRAVGFVFFVPFLLFAFRKTFHTKFAIRLFSIFALGGVQGIVGWIMVKSGLVDSPFVSPIKLALHLGIAFSIFAFILLAILDLKKIKLIQNNVQKKAAYGSYILVAIVFTQIMLGAGVAGTHAGLIYNTWPDMNGEFIPQGLWSDVPSMVQFLHRCTAVFLVVYYGFWYGVNRKEIASLGAISLCNLFAIVLLLQFFLGVLTLLGQVSSIVLALAHQLNALLLWGLSVTILHLFKKI